MLDFQEAHDLLKEFAAEIHYDTIVKMYNHAQHLKRDESSVMKWYWDFFTAAIDLIQEFINETTMDATTFQEEIEPTESPIEVGFDAEEDIGPFYVSIKLNPGQTEVHMQIAFRGESLKTSVDPGSNIWIDIDAATSGGMIGLGDNGLFEQHMRKWFADAAEVEKRRPERYKPERQELGESVILPPYVPVSLFSANEIFKSLLNRGLLSSEEVERMKSQLQTKGEITDQSLVSRFLDAKEKMREAREAPQYTFEGLYSYILNKLIKVANKLDQAGLLEEADEIDKLIGKMQW
jgi:hypothetical protein